MATPKPGEWLKHTATAGTEQIKGKDINVSDAQAAEVEAWLQSFGVKYSKLTEIPLSMIDERGSRANQARATALVDDSVARFVLALKDDQVFPPIVARSQVNRVLIIDGNNREAAYRRVNRETIAGFILHPDTPSETIYLMTVSANANHGVTPELSWRLKQAQHLTTLGFTVERASQAAAVTVSQLRDYQRQLKATQRAEALHVPGFVRLPVGQKVSLGVLALDNVFAQASHVVVETEMSGEETRAFVRAIKASTSETHQLSYISKTLEERVLESQRKAMKDRPVPVKSAKHALITGIGKILAADPQRVAESIITDIERREMIRRLSAVGEKLIELQIALETATEEARSAG